MRSVYLAALVLLSTFSIADAQEYVWSISASSTDPTVNTAELPIAVVNVPLYLWLDCTSANGITAMEAKISFDGNLLPLTILPVPGVINSGSGIDLALSFAGCPSGPFLAATIFTLPLTDFGTLCLTENDDTGNNASFDCAANPILVPNSVRGFAQPAAIRCEIGPDLDCNPVSVEPNSWSGVKSLYR